jgi:Rieske Fe-S protein
MTNIHRRDFLSDLAAAGAGTCLCGAGGCATFSKVGNTPAIATEAYTIEDRRVRIDLDKAPELGEIGGAVKIIDPRLPAAMIVGRTGDMDYVAVSLHCPHRGVEVEYRPKEREFRCASLGHSRFDTDGVRKKGPAQRSLQTFIVELKPDDRSGALHISF